MNKETYTWVWQDTKAMNIHKADSLKAIIHKVINKYFYCGHDDGGNEGIEIHAIEDHFEIAFNDEEGECFAYKVEAKTEAVTTLLELLAKQSGRKDKFCISEV